MILTELTKLYDRLVEDPEYASKIPLQGWSVQNIAYRVVLTPEGDLFDVQDARIEKVLPAKKKGASPIIKMVPRTLIVPGSAHPSGSAATPRFLWDQNAYIFGYSEKSEKDDAKAREVLFPAYRDYHRKQLEAYAIKDSGYVAVVKFLEGWNPEAVPEELKRKIASFGAGFGVFRIRGAESDVYDSPEIRSVWSTMSNAAGAVRGDCLVTGEKNVPIVPVIDTKVKLAGTSVGGGAITSFNAPAYESYGKSQTFNSPISEAAGFKACNALNALISNDRFHVKVAGTTVVFWTGRKTETESLLGFLFGSVYASEAPLDDTLLEKLHVLWKVIGKAGDPDLAELGDDAATPFYMLGIEPNAARIVVRFWHESSLGDLMVKLRRHHSDIARLKTYDNEPDNLPMWQLVRQTARDADGVPPLLAGALLRSVIEGLPYPESMFQLVINRIQVSHRDKNGKYRVGGKVTYEQAAVIKGFLNRNKKKGLKTMLDLENKAPAYLLGRLFATLEKTQGEALGDLNAGVGDKYYSSASATPRIVFPTILDMFRKWIKKLGSERKGLAVVREKLVGEILDGIDASAGFPANLSLEDRGLFAIGYYQQMRAFFAKKQGENEEV